jgi:hypothetical protein
VADQFPAVVADGGLYLLALDEHLETVAQGDCGFPDVTQRQLRKYCNIN